VCPRASLNETAKEKKPALARNLTSVIPLTAIYFTHARELSQFMLFKGSTVRAERRNVEQFSGFKRY
jgi:hypothetical protein